MPSRQAESPGFARTHWRTFALIGVVVLAAGFLFTNRAQVPQAWTAIRQADRRYLFAAFVSSGLYVLNYAELHRAAYRTVGLSLSFRSAFKLASASHFLNLTTVASGGMAGLAPFLGDASARGLERGRVVSAVLLVVLLGHLVFAAFLGVALGVAGSDGQVTRLGWLATLLFVAYTLFLLSLFIAAARSRAAVRWLYGRPAALLSLILRLLRRPPPRKSRSHEGADELHAAIGVILANPISVIRPVIHAALTEGIGVVGLWLCLRAYGVHSGLEEPLVAYSFGVLFGFVGFIPGGIGFAEAGMGLAFASFGIDSIDTILTIATFRLIKLWIPFAVGAVALQLLLRSTHVDSGEPGRPSAGPG